MNHFYRFSEESQVYVRPRAPFLGRFALLARFYLSIVFPSRATATVIQEQALPSAVNLYPASLTV